jgi:acyl carrier protein
MTTLTDNQGRVAEVLLEIINIKGLTTPTLAPDTVLEQLGLESLDFAQMVIRMEELTGKDPFATGTEYQIRTLADLAACYD